MSSLIYLLVNPFADFEELTVTFKITLKFEILKVKIIHIKYPLALKALLKNNGVRSKKTK